MMTHDGVYDGRWMNGIKVFQIKLSRKYGLEDFDEDLRAVMKRAGCAGEKVCFIFDESNVLSTAFLERMNALLASGEVPGLFEGDEHAALMSACKEAAQRDGVVVDTELVIYAEISFEIRLRTLADIIAVSHGKVCAISGG